MSDYKRMEELQIMQTTNYSEHILSFNHSKLVMPVSIYSLISSLDSSVSCSMYILAGMNFNLASLLAEANL